MRRNSRLFTAVALGSLVAPSITGCGGGASPAEPTAESRALSEPGPIEVPEPAAAGVAAAEDQGFLRLTAYPTSNIVYGYFQAAAQVDRGCSKIKAGACIEKTCGYHLGTESAGTATVTGGQTTPVHVKQVGRLNPLWDYGGASVFDFAAGDNLTLSTAGGVVPAFGPLPVAVPTPITLTQPDTTATPFVIDTAVPLHVKWTGGAAGATVVVRADNYDTTTRKTWSFSCEWDATLGAGTIPSAILAPMTNGTSNSFEWLQRSDAAVVAGTYQGHVYGEAADYLNAITFR